MPQFRAKARAVELLGKGQISDLPTAISELWKNGYDAYGDRLEAFLYLSGYEGLKNPFFVISDDGIGMTREDVLNKWLILGTDSKSRNEKDKKGEETLGKAPRCKTGEKGIGRLSVAYLGSQMLMLTKKIGSPAQAVFFDWRILDNYNLFLADINIPIKSVQSTKGFEDIFESIKEEYLSNFEPSNSKDDVWKEQERLKKDIIRECKALELPGFFEEEILSSLVGDTNDIHGTRFIIFNPDPQILLFNSTENEVSDSADGTALYYLRTSLNGLFNTFKERTPPCETRIWIKSKEGAHDFISKGEFFSYSDFEKGDYLIDGEFDEYGEFKGSIRIFEKTIRHKFSSHKQRDKKSSYGPFKIKLGYEEANFDTPQLRGEERKSFEDKLWLYGGIYIYRDDFRVLPYGRRDHDFLEFEERRSKGAGYYFFSHRRMFGYIEIAREGNEKLKDKASREGFINNVAYRDFTKDLRDFFIDLAKTYFRKDATSDIRTEQKEQLQKAIESEKQENEKAKKARKEFADVLKEMPVRLGNVEGRLSDLTGQLDKKLSQSEIQYFEIKELIQKIEDCKIKVEELVVTPPSRFKLTELQRKNLHDYNKSLQAFRQNTLAYCNSVLDKAQERLKEQELLDEYKNRYSQYSRTIENMFQEYGDKLNAIGKNYEKGLLEEKRLFLADFLAKYNDITPKDINKSEIKHSLKLLEGFFNDVREKVASRIEPFVKHLGKVGFDVDEDDLVGYYKIKFEEIEEEWNKTRELAQLGIAVEVIDHQFNVLYSQLSNTIESFSEYVKNNAKAKKHYDMMRNAFEHLENNYKLLQPLYRTTGRIRKDITGKELYEYVEKFFSDKLKEGNISLSISESAKRMKIFSYESIFKPVLVNIVNNAIYWLLPVNDRKILIDSKGDELLILNSGEPIEEYLLEKIFELFYSKKPKGRGIGLYLAKTSLSGVGFDIEATNDPGYNKLNGACFIIRPKNSVKNK
jgi:signal transduction histidine kinase